MKIGIVCPYNLFRPGGVQEAVFAHQKELKKRGHEVKILSPSPRGFNGDVPDGVILIGTSTELNSFKTKSDISIHAGPKEIRQLLREENFDILHYHEPWVPMLARQILDASESINVATFHAKLPGAWIYRTIGKAIRPYTRAIVDDLDCMVAASGPASDHINELIGGEVQIIFNGVDLEKYDPKKIEPLPQYDDDMKTIVFINRLEKRKGPDLLLKAYRELVKDHQDVRLVLASDGDMREKLEAYVQAYELPNVEFLGFIDEETKLRLYKSADLYCAPAPYGEGFGIVLLEAMAMGVPYVGGDNPGYRFASGDKADEYLVDPYVSSLLAHRIEHVLYDDKIRAGYKDWAAKRVKHYDYKVVVDEYEKLYQSAEKKASDKRSRRKRRREKRQD